ncbi:flagellar biosynthesis regulator FlaF [Pseudorhodoplanes sp.]|jgi:flagellar protein FlaF|uniref:flagellar biosynthesis regulator FlaF n=1 Tax=Pseudorhodoplanes sp. TaxID=1934341 RepID=UPI002B8FAF75|nr:flagellar biosynthesis regulator FlaF [Pseudorhodoplanes sp.]HWV42635.1 flagellar biosynthesis regulator FlaF [Pseudorhodoplanes sp.]
MHNAAKAYGTVAQQTASPRELEAQLLLRAASRLQNVHDHWDSQRSGLDHALLFNRKLWTVFLTSATNKDNPLPAEVRQNIANIGIFVINQTLNVMGNPQPERLRSLININRQLAAGLSGGA